MSRVVVERALENSENKWFTWSLKTGFEKFGIVDMAVDGVDYVFVVEADIFELFEKMYRYVEYEKWRWGADAQVAMCSSNECIDLSWVDGLMNDYVTIIPKSEVTKLRMVKDRIRKMIGRGGVSVSMTGEGGRIWIYLNRCETYVYDDEAVALAGLLLDVLYRETGREEYKEMRDAVYEVFRPEEFGLDVTVKRGDICYRDLFYVALGQCQTCMTYEEVVDMIYGLLSLTVISFIESRIVAEEDWDYE
jgi:hypothetical protein